MQETVGPRPGALNEVRHFRVLCGDVHDRDVRGDRVRPNQTAKLHAVGVGKFDVSYQAGSLRHQPQRFDARSRLECLVAAGAQAASYGVAGRLVVVHYEDDMLVPCEGVRVGSRLALGIAGQLV